MLTSSPSKAKLLRKPDRLTAAALEKLRRSHGIYQYRHDLAAAGRGLAVVLPFKGIPLPSDSRARSSAEECFSVPWSYRLFFRAGPPAIFLSIALTCRDSCSTARMRSSLVTRSWKLVGPGGGAGGAPPGAPPSSSSKRNLRKISMI